MNLDFAAYKKIENAIGIEDYADSIIHYSSFETLESLLQSNELWMGHISNMNDTTECSHFLSGIEPAFRDLFDPRTLAQFWPYVEKARNRIMTDTFVSSWCEYSDDEQDGSLYMWQEYGNGGQGIGIIVDSSRFQPSSLTPQKINFFVSNSKVKYIPQNTAASYAEELSRKVYKAISNLDEARRLFATAMMIIASAPTIKHPSFAHEKEIRFLFLDPIPDFRPMKKFMSVTETAAGGSLRPYAQLQLRDYPEYGFDLSPSKILKAILVGPGKDQNQRAQKVYDLLGTNGLEHVEVIRSRIPYTKR
jgi:hypothetical protein